MGEDLFAENPNLSPLPFVMCKANPASLLQQKVEVTLSQSGSAWPVFVTQTDGNARGKQTALGMSNRLGC